jgi:predicted RNA binding protein YcfA (HicA-like mRNA interferase family)
MPRLPRTSSAAVVAALERLGFVRVRTRGSHLVMARDRVGGRRVCVVPMHDELAAGTLRGILRQAGVTPDELVGALRS